MSPGSPGSTCAEIPISSATVAASNASRDRTRRHPPKSLRSRGVGGCDFEPALKNEPAQRPIPWTPQALPSVVCLTTIPTELTEEGPFGKLPSNEALLRAGDGDQVARQDAGGLRTLTIGVQGQAPLAVLLPLDPLFEVRAAAALRAWRVAAGGALGPDPSRLPRPRRDRLIAALRALDGRLDNASYREIAIVLFGEGRVPDLGWKTHDLRDRTVRLARLGFELMRGGYRHLLIYPYRRRS